MQQEKSTIAFVAVAIAALVAGYVVGGYYPIDGGVFVSQNTFEVAGVEEWRGVIQGEIAEVDENHIIVRTSEGDVDVPFAEGVTVSRTVVQGEIVGETQASALSDIKVGSEAAVSVILSSDRSLSAAEVNMLEVE